MNDLVARPSSQNMTQQSRVIGSPRPSARVKRAVDREGAWGLVQVHVPRLLRSSRKLGPKPRS